MYTPAKGLYPYTWLVVVLLGTVKSPAPNHSRSGQRGPDFMIHTLSAYRPRGKNTSSIGMGVRNDRFAIPIPIYGYYNNVSTYEYFE